MQKSLLKYPYGNKYIYYPTDEKYNRCIVIKKTKKGGLWEKRITKLIFNDCKQNHCAIDIGANIGIHSLSMINAVKNGQLIAFEPQKGIARCLEKTLEEYDNVSISNYLVSNKNSMSSFMCNHTGCSRIPIDGKKYNKNWEEKIMKTITLDKYLSINKSLPICLMKIDVEGHEFEVLKGAHDTIHKYKPIIYIEVWKDTKNINKLRRWCEVNDYIANQVSVNDYRLIPK